MHFLTWKGREPAIYEPDFKDHRVEELDQPYVKEGLTVEKTKAIAAAEFLSIGAMIRLIESLDIGSDTLTGVNDADCQPPFQFTGRINQTTLTIDRPKLSREDIKKLEAAQPEKRLSEQPKQPLWRHSRECCPFFPLPGDGFIDPGDSEGIEETAGKTVRLIGSHEVVSP